MTPELYVPIATQGSDSWLLKFGCNVPEEFGMNAGMMQGPFGDKNVYLAVSIPVESEWVKSAARPNSEVRLRQPRMFYFICRTSWWRKNWHS